MGKTVSEVQSEQQWVLPVIHIELLWGEGGGEEKLFITCQSQETTITII